MTLNPIERQVLAELTQGAQRFNAYVIPLSTGWRDGDGRPLPSEGHPMAGLKEEINRMQEHLERARCALGFED